jgi:hypothetical protein
MLAAVMQIIGAESVDQYVWQLSFFFGKSFLRRGNVTDDWDFNLGRFVKRVLSG